MTIMTDVAEKCGNCYLFVKLLRPDPERDGPPPRAEEILSSILE